MAKESAGVEALGKELARFLRLWRPVDEGEAAAIDAMSPEAFRAVVAQRLRALEREVADTRGRINGLMFVVVGAALTQILLRIIG